MQYKCLHPLIDLPNSLEFHEPHFAEGEESRPEDSGGVAQFRLEDGDMAKRLMGRLLSPSGWR